MAGERARFEDRILVPLGERSYEIVLAENFVRLRHELAPLGLGRRAFVLTDRHVAPHYLLPVARALRATGSK